MASGECMHGAMSVYPGYSSPGHARCERCGEHFVEASKVWALEEQLRLEKERIANLRRDKAADHAAAEEARRLREKAEICDTVFALLMTDSVISRNGVDMVALTDALRARYAALDGKEAGHD